ncbi:hypothetical protein D3C86_1813780 [compost metagenome]
MVRTLAAMWRSSITGMWRISASWMRRATVATFSASSPERSMSVSIFDTAISMRKSMAVGW